MSNWWEKYEQEQASDSEPMPWWAKYSAGEPPDRTVGEIAGDLGVSALRGTGNLVGGLAQTGLSLAGGVLEATDWMQSAAGFGDPNLRRYAVATQEGLSGAMDEANQGWRALESEPTQMRNEKFAEDMKAQEGSIDKILFGAQTMITDPAMLTNMLVEQIPNMAGMLSVARRAGASAFEAAMKRGASRKGAQDEAQDAAVRANLAMTGAQGAGFSAADAAQAVFDMSPEDIAKSEAYQELVASGMAPDEARAALARDAANIAATISGPVATATGRLTAGLEARVARGTLNTGAVIPGIMGAAARGSLEEVAQETGEGVGSNIGLRETVDPNREIMDGVAERVGPAMVLGGLMEGGMYGLGRLASGPDEAGKKMVEDILADAGVPLDNGINVDPAADAAALFLVGGGDAAGQQEGERKGQVFHLASKFR